eukprot:TRINITY_DN5465_c0_g1_i3.p4 TRINITY_DN5465_c0_g1~~TRINITY_DN5465_c0_g1_i3.p4  ORF type:complete len:122 (+),score=0.68 TRINITY_DN5465_c0_g1_i3:755-1120(+)
MKIRPTKLPKLHIKYASVKKFKDKLCNMKQTRPSQIRIFKLQRLKVPQKLQQNFYQKNWFCQQKMWTPFLKCFGILRKNFGTEIIFGQIVKKFTQIDQARNNYEQFKARQTCVNYKFLYCC